VRKQPLTFCLTGSAWLLVKGTPSTSATASSCAFSKLRPAVFLGRSRPACCSGDGAASLTKRLQPPPLAPVHTQEGMHHPCPLLHAVRAGCAPGTPHVLKPVAGRLAIMNRSSLRTDVALRKTSPRAWDAQTDGYTGCCPRCAASVASPLPFSSQCATFARFNRSTLATSTAVASSYPCSSTVIQTSSRTSSSLLQRHLTHRQLGDQRPHDCMLLVTSAGYTLRSHVISPSRCSVTAKGTSRLPTTSCD